jgi:hypothetical protein
MKSAPFKSTFAILDVKGGRDALARRLKAGEKVRVRVDMVLDSALSRDDGVSIEFGGAVQSVKQFKAPARGRKGRRA